MNYYYLSSIVNCITSFLVSWLVYTSRKNPPPTNKAFIFFATTTALWAAGYAIWQSSEDFNSAIFWIRFAMFWSILLPIFFFEFILHLIGKDESFKAFRIVALCITSLLLISSFTELFIKSVSPLYGFPFWPRPGPLFYVFHAFFIADVLFAHILMIQQWKNMTGSMKKKVKLVFFATLIGFGGGMTNHFLWYGIPIPPWGNIGISLCVAILAYAIIAHQLMDIDVIIKKTFVFAGLLAFVFAIYATVTLFVRNVLSDYFYVRPLWSNAFSIFLVVLGYDAIRSFLINLTDRFLFQKGYDYHKVLKDASRGMAKIESLKRLLGLVLHFVTMKMRVKNAAVITLETSERLYRLVALRGYQKVVPKLSLSSDHPLIRMLGRNHEAIQLEEIKEQHQSMVEDDSRKNDLNVVIAEMNLLEAVCAIPSFLGPDLKNVLLIGEKKSGEVYTNEDISLLMTLAQESAIAIENARLYDEAIKKQKQLGQINEQLENSKKLLVTALSEAEGANKKLQDAQAQLIHEQKMATLGRLAASVGHEVNNPLTILSMNVSRAILKYRKNPELKVGEILDVFDKMEKNIERIKAVVNTLTGLLKKSEKGKFEPLSLKLILEETLPLVQFQTYMDNLTGTEVELNVPGNIPLIRGDLERLQEIFLNLFINAYHAMANKRFRKIRVDAELDSEQSGMVAVHFTDNGSGMTEEIMKKIFNYGFTTKPPGKGSGLGLYMCKYIVELHGGTIKVKSKLGEGTTFTVTLPIFKDEPTAASSIL